MPTTQQLRSRLINKLEELFQLNQPDLDFGFYRIMHAKAKQVSEFIENDLLKIVEDAFGNLQVQNNEGLLAQAKQKVIETLGEEAFDVQGNLVDSYRNSRVGKRYFEELAEIEKSKNALSAEADIYDHLYRFFERYYDAGDFISRRYYTRETTSKAAPFAVPYNGEEVKLHWANADQYYIKTTEYFNNFTFDLRQTVEVQSAKKDQLALDFAQSTTEDAPRKVHFRIIDASEGEHGNVKASEATKRFFLIHAAKPVEMTSADGLKRELRANFEYRADPERTGQDNTWRERRNGEAVTTILTSLRLLATSDEDAADYLRLLETLAPTESDKKRPLLAKYINQYTARNTMDYFIHKDLGGFLRRELDFYIKNEVMRLDDIENADASAVESYLAKIKVLRKIAGKLIDFVAQLEEFQKKLWLKKKFVVETNYCITLDRVPEELYPEIVGNERQCEEWVKLFAIDEIKASTVAPGYSVPLTVEFLKANDKLVLDTRFFDVAFKAKLIAAIENFDEKCNGVLFHGENFQVLSLMSDRYNKQIRCIYIDPPYNTGGDGFLFRDTYRHSSWITMMTNRLSANLSLLEELGVVFTSIDASERSNLENVLSSTLGSENRVEEIIWVTNATKNQSPTYSTNHEYVEVFARNLEAAKKEFRMFREPKLGYSEFQEMIEELNPLYPSIAVIEQKIRDLLKINRSNLNRVENEADSVDTDVEDWKGLHSYTHAEYRDSNGSYVTEQDAREKGAKIWIWTESDASMPQVKSDSQKPEFRNPEDPTFRFYRPDHPITHKPCPHPKTGWRWPYYPHGNQRTSFSELASDNRIVWGEDETKVPRQYLRQKLTGY